MTRYFIAYSYSHGNTHGESNADIELDRPIRGMAGINAISDRIKDMRFPHIPDVQVVITGWQRFEKDEE